MNDKKGMFLFRMQWHEMEACFFVVSSVVFTVEECGAYWSGREHKMEKGVDA